MSRQNSFGTGNRAVDAAIAMVIIAIVMGVGIMMMGQFCPIGKESVKDNPEALDAMTNLCSIFFQNAPKLPFTFNG